MFKDQFSRSYLTHSQVEDRMSQDDLNSNNSDRKTALIYIVRQTAYIDDK